jgi:hypothetical protein
MLRKEPPAQDICAVEGCEAKAAIIHGGKPLCGKHALERLEQEMAAGRSSPLKE